MKQCQHTENDLINSANFGDYYKLTTIINSLDNDRFASISETVYDLIVDDLIRSSDDKSIYAIYAALNVFFIKTEPFLSEYTKIRIQDMLEEFYKNRL